MFIELIDLLRCPKQHADSWMVAAFNKMDGRFVINGKLGCPICSASYEISDGIADLRLGAEDRAIDVVAATANQQDDEEALRVAALLGLTSPNSLVVLVGASAQLSARVSEMTEARVMAVNPLTSIAETERVAVIRATERFPFAPASIDGVMLDESSTSALARDAGRVLRQGGRLVGPATLELDGQLRQLARDDRNVVAESVGQLIPLSR